MMGPPIRKLTTLRIILDMSLSFGMSPAAAAPSLLCTPTHGFKKRNHQCPFLSLPVIYLVA